MSVTRACCTIADEIISSDESVKGSPSPSVKNAMLVLLSSVISFIFFAWIGRFLWNDYVCSLFSGAKKASSIVPIMGLYVFVRLLIPDCGCA